MSATYTTGSKNHRAVSDMIVLSECDFVSSATRSLDQFAGGMAPNVPRQAAVVFGVQDLPEHCLRLRNVTKNY
jgi:hypothetical protein